MYAETIVGDKFVYFDCEKDLISDKELLEFFDFSNLPIETKKITLDNFRRVVITLLEKYLINR